MFENQVFNELVKGGKPTGEVVAVNQLLARIKGLEGASVNSLILFENGDRGLVRSVDDDEVEVLTFSVAGAAMGMVATLENPVFEIGVGESLIGRVVNAAGQPLDGKGPVATEAMGEVFALAPPIIEREALDKQLVSGVTIVDSMFPIVFGQRIAALGDNKSGKSTFMRQLCRNQIGNGSVTVYVLIAKRQVDVDALIADLTQSGAIKQTIVVVASSFDSLSQAYLAPYVGCAMGEYLWKKGSDVIMIYDDLSSHAKVYRELSLLAGTSPGRDSYPGDMFFAHSSLLERAGKLKKGGTMTALPVVLTPSDDITAYLPTSIMSITDGQLIFDLVSFRKGIRPAVNVGLSVSRVGGRVQNAAWKQLTVQLFRKLASYRQAAEFAQFGSELAPESKADLALGKLLYEVFKQPSAELHSLVAQYLVLAAVLASAGRVSLNTLLLKQMATEKSTQLDPKADLVPVVNELMKATMIQVAAK